MNSETLKLSNESISYSQVRVNEFQTMSEYFGDIIGEHFCPKDYPKCSQTITKNTNYYPLMAIKRYLNTKDPTQMFDQKNFGFLGVSARTSRINKGLMSYPQYLME